MRLSTAAKLAPVLAAQSNVIARRQIVAAGGGQRLAAREVASQRWQVAAPGVYYAFPDPPTLLQRAWCAQLVGGEGSVVSGGLACHLLGIPDAGPSTAVVLVGADCQRRGDCDNVVRRTSRAAPWSDRMGVRVATAPRAVLDAARLLPGLRDVRALVCGALNAKQTSYDALLREWTAEYRDGLALLGRSLQDWADGARSAPECEVADALREQVWRGQLPPFLLNPGVYDGAVLLGAADVYVPGRALGAETDSRRHHGAPDALDTTLQRHKVFAAAGIQLEHVAPVRFRRDPAGWAALFAAIAEQRGPIGDPAGLRIEAVGPLQPVVGRRRHAR